jgi:peptide/nickel transport system substrate-binding protein
MKVRPAGRIAASTLACALLVGAWLATGANAQSTSGTAAPSKVVLTVGTTADMVSPNVFKACCGGEYEMMFMNYDMLFNFSKEDLTPVSGLATFPPEHNADDTEWTFDIRSGVKWSDGEPLTAEDIAFTFNFIVENHMGTFLNYLKAPGEDPPTITAPNATTLVWKSPVPTTAPLTPPWVPILPEHVWKEFDGDPTGAKQFPNVPAVGSGPFHLESWDQGQGWIMSANKDYWGGTPTIDEVDFRVFTNQEAMVQALKAGQIDFAEALNPTLFNSLKDTPGITTHVAPPGYFDNLAFNFGGQGPDATALPALHDVVLRQAIATAIDNQGLVDKLLLGDGSAGTSITMPQSVWHWEPPADQLRTFDIAKANQMLDDAGYADTNDDGVRNDPKTGDELQLDTLTINDITYSNDEGKLIAGWMKQIGIDMTLIPVSENKAYDLWGQGDFDAYIWDWGGDPDPDFILSIFTTDQCLDWSDGCYSDPKYDAMYAKQKTILDPEERRAYVAKMQEYIYEQVPEVVTVYENDLQAYRSDRWTGFTPVPEPDGYLLFGWGPYSYISMKPAVGSTEATDTQGIKTSTWLIVILVIIVAAGLIVLIRRRKGDEDRA